MPNNKEKKKPELLAPAGSPEALKSAVINGADAVYLGLSEFSARAKAQNFSKDNLKLWVDYAALYGVKVYLAVNTVLKDCEVGKALELIEFAHGAGVAAVIVQDIGLIREARRTLPHIILHASTQMGIHNYEGALAAYQLGLSRIIMSRETLLTDIERIKREIDIEVECFVQGALCVAFSGNCYYSSLVTGNSGNRGRCLQFCRKHYTVTGGGAKGAQIVEGNLLSAKDLRLLPVLERYIKAGVDSFKIEGRMRRTEYVGGAVSVYRHAIDNGGAADGGVPGGDTDGVLERLYNRGGYLAGYSAARAGERECAVVFPQIQGHMGLYKGKVGAVNNGRAVLDAKFFKGDGLKFTRDGKETGAALVQQDGNTTTFTGSVRAGDSVMLTTDAALNREIAAKERKITADISVRAVAGHKLELTFSAGGVSITEKSDWEVSSAVTAPLSAAELAARVSKLNNTPFVAGKVDLVTDNAFIVISKLNALRNLTAERLESAIITHNLNNWYDENIVLAKKAAAAGAGQVLDNGGLGELPVAVDNGGELGELLVAVDNMDILPALKGRCGTVMYCPEEYLAEDFKSFCAYAAKLGIKVYLNLPVMVRGGDRKKLDEVLRLPECGRVVINNIYGLGLAGHKEVIYGTGLNIVNSFGFGGNRIASTECAAPAAAGDYVGVYIHRPLLMVMAHCPNYTTGAADCGTCGNVEPYSYTDDHGLNLWLRRVRLHYCYRELRAERPYKNTQYLGGRKYVDLCGLKDECRAAEVLDGLGIAADPAKHFLPKDII